MDIFFIYSILVVFTEVWLIIVLYELIADTIKDNKKKSA
jgi:hypothetical protein